MIYSQVYINEDKVGVKQEGTNKPEIPFSSICLVYDQTSNIFQL